MTSWFRRRSVAPPIGIASFDTYAKLDFDIPKSAPIEEMEFVVFDCEMTGLDREAELVSLGALRVCNKRMEVGEALDLRFDFSANNAAAEIHGEMNNRDSINTSHACDQILDFIGNRVLVGHSVRLDVRQVSQLLQRRYPKFKLKNKVVDTFDLMRRIDPVRFERSVAGQSSLRLDPLCQEMNIVIENRHTALGDAYLTAQLFLKLLSRLRRRKVLTAGQLLRG